MNPVKTESIDDKDKKDVNRTEWLKDLHHLPPIPQVGQNLLPKPASARTRIRIRTETETEKNPEEKSNHANFG